MAIYDLKTNLDLKQNLNLYMTCKQLDNLNLILSIYDNSIQVNLSNYTVRLKAMKADKIPLIQERTGISISSNIVTIVADEQLTTTSGKTLIELQFIDNTGKKKATFNLVLSVVSSTLEVDRSISKATYTLLEELENKLDQASDFFQNISEAVDANNNLITTINNANTAKNNLDSSIRTGNTLKEQLDSNISSGETLKEGLEADITSGSNLKNGLETTITNATNIKDELDTFVEEHPDVNNLVETVAEHTTQLNERMIKTYYSLSQINISDSDLADKTQIEIADIIINAMPDNSILELYISGTTTSNIGILFPIRYDGILRILKDTIKGCRFSFLSQTNRSFESFYASWKNPTLAGWVEISVVEDSGWLDLPLSTGISSETGYTCQYRKVGKIVMLRGMFKGVTNDSIGTIIATLPAGYRPSAVAMALCPKSTNDSNYAKIAISASGTIMFKGSDLTTIANTNGFFLTETIFFIG